jgi:DNA helicase-2/ATP-dependent DNA helicase PcrA
MNPSDSISLKRIINTPARGIGKTTLDKIESLALDFELQGQAGTFWSALQRASRDPSITSAGTAKKLLTFVTFVEKLRDAYPKVLLSELYHLLLDETGYVTDLRKEGTEEALGRVENLEEFDSLLLEFEEDALRELSDEQIAQRRSQLLPQFLEQSSLASDADSKMLHESGSSVSMMTLHSCKGLEFPVVFMVGMEEGLFPSIRGWEQEDPDDIEEERRLCYVGMTRARELLFMTHVNVRRIWGNVTYQEPARFFAEIPANLVSFQRKPVHQPTSSVAGESVVGMTVDHPVYGHGSVIACDGSGNDAKVTIEFRGQDRRKFLLRFIKEMLDD